MNTYFNQVLDFLKSKSISRSDKIPVAVFADIESFNSLFFPRGNLSFQSHTEKALCLVDFLVNQGYNAFPVKLSLSEYYRWLGDDLNCPQKRAEFVAFKSRIQ